MFCQLVLHIKTGGNVSKTFTQNNCLNTTCLVLSVTITILNVFIDAFGEDGSPASIDAITTTTVSTVGY